MNALSFEGFVNRAGTDVSLDLVGMFLMPNDLHRMVVLSLTCSRRLARRQWNIVNRCGDSSGTVTYL